MIIINEEYPLPAGGKCNVRVFRNETGPDLILVTDPENNKGMSVTNYIEILACNLRYDKRIQDRNDNQFFQIEFNSDAFHEAVYDQVIFEWKNDNGLHKAYAPQWKKYKFEDVQYILDEYLVVEGWEDEFA